MFWRSKRKKNPRIDRRKKVLRVEALESRHMLSGFVNVYTLSGEPGGPTTVALGDLYVYGDSSEHSIKMTASGNTVTISSVGTDDTTFRLNTDTGSGTLGPVTVPDITGNITVNLAQGGGAADTFDFEAPATTAGSVSTVYGNLNIINGTQTNKINDVVIQGNLSVTHPTGLGQYNELDMIGSTVYGTTYVMNGLDPTGTGGGTSGGDSYTNIVNCLFGANDFNDNLGVPLTIQNGDGNNHVSIEGVTAGTQQAVNQTTAMNTTQIGSTPVTGFNAQEPALEITDGTGGSNCVFTNAAPSQPLASDPLIYGEIQITNGECQDFQNNGVSFGYTAVSGPVLVNNNEGGDTEVFLQASNLGTQLVNGGPLQIDNSVTSGAEGANEFYMTAGSGLPWGLFINNEGVNSINNQTIIDSSFIGETTTTATVPFATSVSLKPTKPYIPSAFASLGAVTGDAAFITGGETMDTVVVRNNTQINGALDLNDLGVGVKDVALDSSTIASFYLSTAAPGMDNLWIGGTTIAQTLDVSLASQDTVWLQKGFSATTTSDSLPTPATGSFTLTGGAGTNNLFEDSSTELPTQDTSPPALNGFIVSSGVTVAEPVWAQAILIYPTFPTD